MTASFIEKIDWSRPWLAPYRETGQAILAAADWRTALNAAAQRLDLDNHCGFPIRFVAQADLPPSVAYEAFISETGCVPTRDNLHDFFNALVWLTFPQIKRQLNALQSEAIKKSGGVKTRGNLRDAATIFDENAALVTSSDQEWLAALRGHRWQEALLMQSAAFQKKARIVLFGHALLEKLVMPYKAITAHVWVVADLAGEGDAPFIKEWQHLDRVVATQLANDVTTARFTHLPILGIPGWWAGQDAAFYADAAVFRPARTRK
jgi:hypothetical protein